MYPYDYLKEFHPLNVNEVFVAMPFDPTYDDVYEKLIKRAVDEANKKLGKATPHLLQAYRTKSDPGTILGWEEVMKRLAAGKIILGVLTTSNENVFYELGIAHATQPLFRQILIAEPNYKSKFDTKDINYTPYDFDKLGDSVEALALKIEAGIRWSDQEDDERIKRVKRQLGPMEFWAALNFGKTPNFALAMPHPKRTFDPMLHSMYQAVGNLCRLGMLALHTAPSNTGQGDISFSYHWTRLGNDILASRDLAVINQDEVQKRIGSAPA